MTTNIASFEVSPQPDGTATATVVLTTGQTFFLTLQGPTPIDV